MNRVLITGVNGLLGQNLVRVLGGGWNEVCGTDLSDSPQPGESLEKMVVADLSEPDAIKKVLEATEPEWVVHTAAYTDVDGAETNSDLAMTVNAGIPQQLADECARQGIRLLHISTDYVFNGKAGPYRESAIADPRGIYAQSKYAGEVAVTESGANWVVLRPNVLYGHGQNLRSSFVHWLIGELKAGRKVNIVDDQFNNPTYAFRLAEVCEILMANESSGIWHFGCREIISRYDFALTIAQVFELDPALIASITTASLNQAAPRPLKSGLICDKLEQTYQVPILSVKDELELLKEEINVS